MNSHGKTDLKTRIQRPGYSTLRLIQEKPTASGGGIGRAQS
jgi:hypothetical protein